MSGGLIARPGRPEEGKRSQIPRLWDACLGFVLVSFEILSLFFCGYSIVGTLLDSLANYLFASIRFPLVVLASYVKLARHVGLSIMLCHHRDSATVPGT